MEIIPIVSPKIQIHEVEITRNTFRKNGVYKSSKKMLAKIWWKGYNRQAKVFSIKLVNKIDVNENTVGMHPLHYLSGFSASFDNVFKIEYICNNDEYELIEGMMGKLRVKEWAKKIQKGILN